MSKNLKAVVVGGTGAVGREVLGQLLVSPHWVSVVAVGRRPAEPPASYQQQPGYDAGKLQQAVVNMDSLEAEARDAFAGANSVFCCLGTTRGAAGSAEQFKKVDLHYVEATVRAAKAAAVPHFSLVSAQGAKAGVWASDWKPFHGLLYMKTKGQAEEAVKAAAFPYATIMRPGLLDRGDMARGVEKLYAKIAPSVAASQVARCMVQDAERWHSTRAAGAEGAPVVRVFEMKDIQRFQ